MGWKVIHTLKTDLVKRAAYFVKRTVLHASRFPLHILHNTFNLYRENT